MLTATAHFNACCGYKEIWLIHAGLENVSTSSQITRASATSIPVHPTAKICTAIRCTWISTHDTSQPMDADWSTRPGPTSTSSTQRRVRYASLMWCYQASAHNAIANLCQQITT